MSASDGDRSFGPRVNAKSRSFDFTLTFEDAFFHLLPSALFLVLVPIWLLLSHGKPRKLRSHRLAITKLVSFCFPSQLEDLEMLFLQLIIYLR
jgi:ATP-binding cassette subfamily C (CFTR/MRP) protein 1